MSAELALALEIAARYQAYSWEYVFQDTAIRAEWLA